MREVFVIIILVTNSTCHIHDWLKYTDCQKSYCTTHDDEDNWLNEFLYTADRNIYFFIIKVRNFDDSIADLCSFFTYTNHRNKKIREEGIVLDSFCDFLSCFDIFFEENNSLFVYFITNSSRYNSDSLYYCYTTIDKVSKNTSKSR